MSLGSDESKCAGRFIDAMHDRLESEKPGTGDNAKQPPAKPNLDALGWAVYRILTVDTDVVTSPAFWQWVSQLATWITQMQAWQQGVKAAVNSWAPTAATDTQLRTAILALTDPAPPGVAPPPFQGKLT